MGTSTVIGYVALLADGKVLGNKDAYIVAGSENLMKRYIARLSTRAPADYRCRTITVDDVMERLVAGSSFVFDQPSYRRLVPLARPFGLALAPEHFPADAEDPLHFVKVGIPKSW